MDKNIGPRIRVISQDVNSTADDTTQCRQCMVTNCNKSDNQNNM